jgi:pimeloyl-ACP methyl ester carboxylesterase
VLFSDLQGSHEEQAKYWEGVVTHSQDAFEIPVTFSAADISIPKSYLICTQDQCVPGPLQEQLAESLGFKAERIDAGHFPFLSQPERCLEILKTMIL